jgi:hypothetical protein
MAASWSSSAAVDGDRCFAQALHGRGFQHHAQVVELLELVEVERQHAPAAAKQHLDEALLLQPEQRLAHRRARHAQAFADLVLGEAVAGHQLELGDVALELRVHLVGARTEHGGRRVRGEVGAMADTGPMLALERGQQHWALGAVHPTMAPCARIISMAPP